MTMTVLNCRQAIVGVIMATIVRMTVGHDDEMQLGDTRRYMMRMRQGSRTELITRASRRSSTFNFDFPLLYSFPQFLVPKLLCAGFLTWKHEGLDVTDLKASRAEMILDATTVVCGVQIGGVP
jgi:hypothetical protein